ncbi:MAG: hypothetical protein R3Y59_02040 [bacterium]
MKRFNYIAKIITMCIAVQVIFFASLRAQNNTNSPYSLYGYGSLVNDGFSTSQAMAGTSIATRSKYAINPTNPASYSSSDSTTFLFEMGVSGLFTTLTNDAGYNVTGNGNLDYITLQTPLTKWMGLSAGLTPFSYTGYSYSVSDSIVIPGRDSTNYYTQSYYGSGGISQVYLGLSFNIANHVSLGVNGYYMYGNINNYKAVSYSSSENTTYSTVRNSYMTINNFNMRFGIQYYETIGRKHAFNIGAIYEYKSGLNGSYNEITYGTDTIEFNSEDLFELPALYGFGVSYTYDNRMTFAVDYQLQQFADALYYGVTDSLCNSSTISVGSEYIHNPNGRTYADRILWRAGVSYNNSYIKVNDNQAYKFTLTCGVGLPLRTSKTIINIGLEYGNIGTYNYTAVNENYLKLCVNLSLNETWFVKSKIR